MFALVSRFAPRALVAAVASLLLPALASAEIVLAPLFTDGAVLQREKPVAVWGTAAPGELVSVTFLEQKHLATADPSGRWVVRLDPLPPTVTGADLTVSGKTQTVVVHDVVVGDVWLCSGQSNMEFVVRNADDAPREIAAANYPLIRHVRIERQVETVPADRVATSGWKPATPANVGDFTAVGYFFARDLQPRVGVPIGLVHSSYGGTPIEAWLSPMGFGSSLTFQVGAERWAAAVATYPSARADYESKLAAWTAGEAAAQRRGERALATWSRQNPRPGEPHGGPGDPAQPTVLFNGMVNPLLPYSLCGILWYQGESNTDHPSEYHALFSTLITTWRAHFGQGDLPFYWVNLPGWQPNDPSDASWAILREQQTKALALPNTAQAVAIDLGDPVNIHPRNKQEVGRRLALIAKRRVYGYSVDDTGPTFLSATPEGAAMRVRFSHVDTGLVAHGRPPQSLELAGADHVFHPAMARIEHGTLLVTAPPVREPVAVRYAWHNCPDANLSSGAGLPMVPFRSDTW